LNGGVGSRGGDYKKVWPILGNGGKRQI